MESKLTKFLASRNQGYGQQAFVLDHGYQLPSIVVKQFHLQNTTIFFRLLKLNPLSLVFARVPFCAPTPWWSKVA
jgi:hypothetical protein